MNSQSRWSGIRTAFPAEQGLYVNRVLSSRNGVSLKELWGRFQEAHRSRFLVIQAIGAALLVNLWMEGLLEKPFTEVPDARLCWIIVGIWTCGIYSIFREDWRNASWFASFAVMAGFFGTVLGLAIAFAGIERAKPADTASLQPLVIVVVGGIGISLYTTILGLAANVWIRITMRVLGGDRKIN